MNPLLRPVVALVLAAAVVPQTAAAAATDVAELFPPDTLAYAELHDPATLSPQLAAVLKGTVLEDSIPFIHNRRDAAKDPRDLVGKEQLAILGLLASPEMAAEVRKLRGVAVGLTGFNDQGDAEAVAAVLTGESQAAGLVARAFLTMSTVRKVGAVGPVAVYQLRHPNVTFEPDGRQRLVNDKPPSEGMHEPTFAYVPGLFVVGTSKAAVGEVVTRFLGSRSGSLAASPLFKEAAAARRPGLFVFGNAQAFFAKYDQARRNEGGTLEPDALGWFRLVTNGKAVRYVVGGVQVRDGGLALTVGGEFDPALKSPLLDFLTGPATKVEVGQTGPVPAAFAVTVSLPDTERAARVIGLLDAVAKADGELGKLPGAMVREWEEKCKLSVADGLIGKTRSVTVLLPTKQDLPKGARPFPMFILNTDGPDVATGWAEALPKIVGDVSKTDPPQPSSEVVNGVKVYSLPGGGLPSKAAVHYARKDGVFVIGLDRKLVAAAAAGETGGAGDVAKGTTGAGGRPPALVGSLRSGDVLRLLTDATRPEGQVVPVTPVTPSSGLRPPGEAVSPSDDQKKDETKAWGQFLSAFDRLPPAELTAGRTVRGFRLEVWQPKIQDGGLAPVVSAAVGWFDKILNQNHSSSPRFGRFREDND